LMLLLFYGILLYTLMFFFSKKQIKTWILTRGIARRRRHRKYSC
jgi:hypothetical protein